MEGNDHGLILHWHFLEDLSKTEQTLRLDSWSSGQDLTRDLQNTKECKPLYRGIRLPNFIWIRVLLLRTPFIIITCLFNNCVLTARCVVWYKRRKDGWMAGSEWEIRTERQTTSVRHLILRIQVALLLQTGRLKRKRTIPPDKVIDYPSSDITLL
jgi:hypothetical protein